MGLLIIGGDKRSLHLFQLVRARGYRAELVGHGETPLHRAAPAERVVMPFPTAEAEGFAPAPFSKEKLPMEAVCALILPGAKVYATRPGPLLTRYMEQKGVTHVDFTKSELFTQRNAIPSAEGAIYRLMAASEGCIDGSTCLVIGYGRIGRALALRLMGLNARVVVAARSSVARAQAEADGAMAVDLSALWEIPCQYLINTVPQQVMDIRTLRAFTGRVIMADVASPPYGFDVEAAEQLGHIAFRAPGIPGIYAPETAARAMLEIMEETDGA